MLDAKVGAARLALPGASCYGVTAGSEGGDPVLTQVGDGDPGEGTRVEYVSCISAGDGCAQTEGVRR